MLTVRLYMAQRLTALIMAPLVIGHIAVMIYAVQNGLSAEEILGRTKGSLAWGLFYGTFVVAVAIHAAIGFRVIAYEVFKLPEKALTPFTVLVFVTLFLMGMRAVLAVTLP
ncbi:MAG: succinate dehydrogenase [Pseudomonadota bacterium]